MLCDFRDLECPGATPQSSQAGLVSGEISTMHTQNKQPDGCVLVGLMFFFACLLRWALLGMFMSNRKRENYREEPIRSVSGT